MSFYMIAFGLMNVGEVYTGKTRLEAVANARKMIDCWPEYALLSDEEILELLQTVPVMEFELVKIPGSMPPENTSMEKLIELYKRYWD